MVARRRLNLKRPSKRSARLAKHRVHVSLAEAGIDRVAAKVDHAVEVMHDEIHWVDERGSEGSTRGIEAAAEGEESDGDGDGDGFLGTKII